MVDFFSVINKNARLRKNMAAAQKVTAVGEFNGPDGDYVCNLKRFTAYEKDGVVSTIFEFRTVNDGTDYSNKKIVIFIRLDDGPLYSAEEAQGVMFQTIQLMGIETDGVDQKVIESELEALSTNDTQIIVRKKTTKKNKEGKITEYKNYSVIGINDTPVETFDEVDLAVVPESNEGVTDDVSDDWPEEVVTDEEVVEYKPSDYVGSTCSFKGKECEIVDATDEDNTVVIKDKKSGRKVKVAFDQLEWPETE